MSVPRAWANRSAVLKPVVRPPSGASSTSTVARSLHQRHDFAAILQNPRIECVVLARERAFPPKTRDRTRRVRSRLGQRMKHRPLYGALSATTHALPCAAATVLLA